MHFQYFAQLFTILTFCRKVWYSAGLVFFTTELHLRVRSYELRFEPRSVDVVFKWLESDWIQLDKAEYETHLQKVRIVKSCAKYLKCIDLVIYSFYQATDDCFAYEAASSEQPKNNKN